MTTHFPFFKAPPRKRGWHLFNGRTKGPACLTLPMHQSLDEQKLLHRRAVSNLYMYHPGWTIYKESIKADMKGDWKYIVPTGNT